MQVIHKCVQTTSMQHELQLFIDSFDEFQSKNHKSAFKARLKKLSRFSELAQF